MQASRMIAAGGALCCIVAGGLMSFWSAPDAVAQEGGEPPEVLELTGIVRDFRERTVEGGHPDFEMRPERGFGHYVGNVAGLLGEDGNPVFAGDGHKVSEQWTDAAGRPICWRVAERYPEPGDEEGLLGAADTGGIASGERFKQWYNDVPGVNMSNLLTLTLVRQDDGTYVFDDELDEVYQSRGGFFPIDDQLYGNSGGSPDHNFHFTFELHGTFVYNADGGQIFKFVGDDDVWVFINGELVIDIGGVHSAVEQYVDLNRLALQNGDTYRLDFFFAERHRTQSNFRIVTNLEIESIDPPTVTAIFD